MPPSPVEAKKCLSGWRWHQPEQMAAALTVAVVCPGPDPVDPVAPSGCHSGRLVAIVLVDCPDQPAEAAEAAAVVAAAPALAVAVWPLFVAGSSGR